MQIEHVEFTVATIRIDDEPGSSFCFFERSDCCCFVIDCTFYEAAGAESEDLIGLAVFVALLKLTALLSMASTTQSSALLCYSDYRYSSKKMESPNPAQSLKKGTIVADFHR